MQDGRHTIITNYVFHKSVFYPYSYKKSIVGDDRVFAILQYRPSDLYLTDRNETMAILQKDTHTPQLQIRSSLVHPFLPQDKLLIQMHLDLPATHGHLASREKEFV